MISLFLDLYHIQKTENFELCVKGLVWPVAVFEIYHTMQGLLND